MPVDVSFYNRPVADPLSGVGSAVGVANGLLNNRIANQDFNARLAVGNAFQRNTNPDGTLDQAGLGAAIQADPNAALGAAQALQQGSTLRGSNIANANAAAAGNQDQTGNAVAAMNSIAANPGAKRSDIMAEANARLHSGALPGVAYHQLVDNMPPDNAGAIDYIKTKAGGMLTPLQQVTPTKAGVNADLSDKMVPGIGAVKMAQRPAGFAGNAPPGVADVAAEDKKALFNDQVAANDTMRGLQPLKQAFPLIGKLSNSDFGPGSPELAQIKGYLDTAGITDPNSQSLPGRQEVGKLLSQYVNQSRTADRSDAALIQQLKSSPNESLTIPANLSLIKTVVGNDQMRAATAKIYSLDKEPGQSYSEFKSGYNQRYDPRAFSFDMLTPEERGSLRDSLGPKTDKNGNLTPKWQKFQHSYDMAKAAGMVQPPQAQPAAPGAQ